jgi:hypothetical protein
MLTPCFAPRFAELGPGTVRGACQVGVPQSGGPAKSPGIYGIPKNHQKSSNMHMLYGGMWGIIRINQVYILKISQKIIHFDPPI